MSLEGFSVRRNNLQRVFSEAAYFRLGLCPKAWVFECGSALCCLQKSSQGLVEAPQFVQNGVEILWAQRVDSRRGRRLDLKGFEDRRIAVRVTPF